MDSTWETRDLPVLAAVVEHFEDPEADGSGVSEIVAATGLKEVDVRRTLRALDSASPPYLDGVRVDQASYPVIVTEVTDRAGGAVADAGGVGQTG